MKRSGAAVHLMLKAEMSNSNLCNQSVYIFVMMVQRSNNSHLNSIAIFVSPHPSIHPTIRVHSTHTQNMLQSFAPIKFTA